MKISFLPVLLWLIANIINVYSSPVSAQEDCSPPQGDFPEIQQFYEDIAATGLILKEVKVALIDSGVDSENSSLQGKLTNEGISFVPDKNFHGTTETIRRIQRLSDKTQRTAEEERELQALHESVDGQRTEIAKVLQETRGKLEELRKTCDQNQRDKKCSTIPSLEEKARLKDLQLRFGLNPDHRPYQRIEEFNKNTEPGLSEHGTHLAGIIAGKRNLPHSEFKGIAENARLIVIKVINSPNESELDEQVAHAIRYAVDHHARIINISLGKYSSDKPELVTGAFDYAKENGAVIVLSAGNSGKDLDVVAHYPVAKKSQKNVFVIGSNTKNTNYGGRVDFHVVNGNDSKEGSKEAYYKSSILGDRVESKKGSSMSASYVSGIFALALGINPDLSPEELRTIVEESYAPFEHSSQKDSNQLVSKKFLWGIIERRLRHSSDHNQ